MANTYSSIYLHLVFSTKNREPWITEEIEQRLWKFIGGIARENNATAIQIGGVEDHIHLLVKSPPAIATSKLAQCLKGGSSSWIHTEFPHLKHFKWQDGYGAFSVSKSSVDDVVHYIKDQREHHRVKSFQEEYLAFLQRHEISFDPKYLWD